MVCVCVVCVWYVCGVYVCLMSKGCVHVCARESGKCVCEEWSVRGQGTCVKGVYVRVKG